MRASQSSLESSRRWSRCGTSVGLFALVLMLSACSEPSRDPPMLMRLVSALPQAEVESPLLGLPAASSISELGDVALEEVWQEDFEGSEPRFTLAEGCGLEATESRGTLLACRDGGEGRAAFAVQPSTGYRIRLEARRLRALGYAIRVTEHGEGDALRIHRFPDLSERWQSHEIWLFSTASTQTLEISFGTQHPRGQLWLDDVIVERLDLTHEQEMRLLKAWSPRSAGDVELGMAKRGRLLPVSDPQDVDAPLQANYVVRDALLAPPPTDLHFRLRVPEAARISLAYALAERSAPGGKVRFRVLASEDGRPPKAVLDETLTLGAKTLGTETPGTDAEGRRWQERDIPLNGFAGREVRLTLETRSVEGSERTYPLWGSPEIYTPRYEDEPPNVILIAVDTLRADRLGSYGHSADTSPAVDALAADGTLFEQAIASANLTTPSFFSLFTGRAAPDLPESLAGAPEITLAESFQSAGYATAAILYKPKLFDHGFERGFDTYFNVPRYGTLAEDNLADALAWLDRNRNRRFKLFLHFNDPHQPFCQPAETVGPGLEQRLGRYDLELPIMVRNRQAVAIDLQSPISSFAPGAECSSCLEAGRLTPEFKRLANDLYDDAVRYADDHVGHFLEALKAAGLYDDAVIAFVSDHGETLWSHGEQFGHGLDNLHDELIRVPLIVKPPRGKSWRTDGREPQQVRLLDLKPTLLELAGIEPPTSAARSLLPSLRPSSPDARRRELPALSVGSQRKTLSVRHEGWKYIRFYPKKPGQVLREALFHLETDPEELMDLAPENPPDLERLRLVMDEQILAHGTGRLVVITGNLTGDARSKARIQLRWDRETALGPLPYPGLEPVGPAAEATWGLDAAAERPLLLLTSFLAPQDAELEVTVGVEGEPERRERITPGEMPEYREGQLTQLLTRPGIQIRVFAGRDPTLRSGTELPPVDARQLETLKALGYLP
ncbi:MAG: sulfatase [Acidobacteriota bacterium]